MKRALYLLIFSLIIFLCSCVSFSQPVKAPANKILVYRTIFIDKSFTLDQQNQILSAMYQWECSTDNMVKFVIGDYTNDHYTALNPLYIENTTSTDERIALSDKDVKHRPDNKGRVTFGLFTGNDRKEPVILLPRDRLQALNKVFITMLHELGHSIISINHSMTVNSVMYPYQNEGTAYITEEDIKSFCDIYKCDYKTVKNVCKK